MKWRTLEEFESYHHGIIRKTCDALVDENLAIIIGDMACELWSKTRKFARRAYLNLAFDCCYIILRMCGHPATIVELEAVALEIVKKPVVVWKSNRGQWWKEKEAENAVLEVCGPDRPNEILPLFYELTQHSSLLAALGHLPCHGDSEEE